MMWKGFLSNLILRQNVPVRNYFQKFKISQKLRLNRKVVFAQKDLIEII